MILTSDSMVGIVAQVAVGLILVFMGRRLFWFFVGVVGFFLGFKTGLSLSYDATISFVVACVIGVVAALLSVILQKVLIVLAGAASGWLLFPRLAEVLGVDARFSLLVAIVGAVLFAIISLMVFDAALIIISALSGATLVLEPVSVAGMLGLILFVGLAGAGAAAQFAQLREPQPG